MSAPSLARLSLTGSARRLSASGTAAPNVSEERAHALAEAVRDAYGWHDLDLAHGFHEVDFLPENDRVRYTISPAARKKVLRRLLLLNHERYAEEQAGSA